MSGCFAYVSNLGDGTVHVLHVTSADTPPELVQIVTYGDGPGEVSTPMALSPGGERLYAVWRQPPFPIITFRRDPVDGRLTEAGRARLPASSPYIAIDRTGRCLLSTANPGATVAVSGLAVDGTVERLAGAIVAIGFKVHCAVVGPCNRHAYVAATSDGQIFQFLLDADAGRLLPLDPPYVQLSGDGDPRHLVVSADGRFLYANTEHGATVVSFAVDPISGCLREVEAVDMIERTAVRPSAADLHLTPDGRYLYSSERSTNVVVGFAVDASSGRLQRLGSTATDGAPRGFAITPDGQTMLVAGRNTGRVRGYGIDARTGGLTPGWSVDVGPGPNWIEVAAAG